jgi:hypothetical protein
MLAALLFSRSSYTRILCLIFDVHAVIGWPSQCRNPVNVSQEKGSAIALAAESGFPQRLSRFDPRLGHMGCVVDSVGFLRVFMFSLSVLIPLAASWPSIIGDWYSRLHRVRSNNWTHLTPRYELSKKSERERKYHIFVFHGPQLYSRLKCITARTLERITYRTTLWTIWSYHSGGYEKL